MAALSTSQKQERRCFFFDNPKPSSPNNNHSATADIVHDFIIGFADGLTVPFALTAGLSSLGSSRLVIIAGLAELFSGAISMGLGAYLAAVTDRDRYLGEKKREKEKVSTKPEVEIEGIYDVLAHYGISRNSSNAIVNDLVRDEDSWVRFMMDFKVKVKEPDVSRAWISGATMGFAYLIGGLLPMIPYFAIPNTTHALFVSIALTLMILLAFGFVKNYITVKTKRSGFYGAVQTLIIGALAAGASYGIVRGVNNGNLHLQ
jgi:VIT1/CCC1 family predicted Fe2+/Mn2+ transporter